jgi:hypothetical protein
MPPSPSRASMRYRESVFPIATPGCALATIGKFYYFSS